MPPVFQPLFALLIMLCFLQNAWAAPADWCEKTPGVGRCA